ncbi:MAG: glycosyltransferase family 9 protein [Candidatus Omnitrophica bacterium]|nr:glycosyltransferase family 9 protein [Candidatus Omnitrophota bacterium]
MKRILIINPFGIGDCLFTAPVIKNLKINYPESFIGYWCNERVKDLLKNIPGIDRIFALSRGDLKKIFQQSKLLGIKSSLDLYRQIKKEHFDLAVDFSLDHRYGFVAKLCAIRERIGFDYKGRGRFLTKKLKLSGYVDKHAIEYYLDLLRLIDLEPKNFDLELKVDSGAKDRVKQILAQAGVNQSTLLIAMAAGAGASWGLEANLKHWPAENYSLLADSLIERSNAKIMLLGDASELPIAQTIISSMQHKAIDLVGKTSLAEFAAAIDCAQLLITNDGGPLHIAVALGKKTLSFFGPVDPKVYGPFAAQKNRHMVLRRNLECSPCYRNFSLVPCKAKHECLVKIDVAQALEAATALLS